MTWPFPGNILDLTHTYQQSTKGFQTTSAKNLDQDGWNASTLQLYSHAGTHMDAPIHFGLPGTIDELDPHQLMGKAWVAKITDPQPSALLFPEDLGLVKDQLQPGDSLLIATGWSQFLETPSLFRDQLPRISERLAKWLVKKEVKMLGVEPPSVADVNNLSEVTKIHKILFQGKVTIIEGLVNIQKIQTSEVWLMAFPLKIQSGDGAPARVVAIEIA